MRAAGFAATSSRVLWAVILGVLPASLPGGASLQAQGRFAQLLERVPRDSNTVVILNVRSVLNSPLAVR
jgi:hypothetical protein